MSDLSQTPTATLFKQWKSGDAPSGQAMAQRFSDWYYAVTTCRLGDAHGRQPLQRACVRFQQGILSVTTAAELTNWAHGLLLEELRMAGGRIPGGDFPNQLTTGRSPTELLRQVAAKLDTAQLRLLADAYDASVELEVVSTAAEAMGGYPFAVLHARLLLKRALRDHAGVAFTEVPDAPNLDLAPLPLYEAGRMAKEAEETGFEQWMLTDMRLCKDIAEFGVFSQALRAGALRGLADAPAPVPAAPPAARSAAPRPAAPAPRAPAEASDATAPAPTKGSGATIPLLAAGVVAVVGILMILVALAWIFMGSS